MENIETILDFSSHDTCYIMMALQRKKDGFPVNNNEGAKRRIISNMDEYKEYFEEFKQLKNYRIYLTYNRRSIKKAYNSLLTQINHKLLFEDKEISTNYIKKIGSEFKSQLMKPENKYKTDYFLYDFDGDFDEKGFENQVSEFTEIALKIKTPNGIHYLVKPFNFNLVNNHFEFFFKHVEFKHDAMVLIYYNTL